MVTNLSRPLPVRSPVARLLSDVNIIVRRAKALEAAGVHVPVRKQSAGRSQRAGILTLRRSGREALYRKKCSEMRPMGAGLYYAACDAILVIMVKDDLDSITRDVLLSDWLRITMAARED